MGNLGSGFTSFEIGKAIGGIFDSLKPSTLGSMLFLYQFPCCIPPLPQQSMKYVSYPNPGNCRTIGVDSIPLKSWKHVCAAIISPNSRSQVTIRNIAAISLSFNQTNSYPLNLVKDRMMLIDMGHLQPRKRAIRDVKTGKFFIISTQCRSRSGV